jgi:hypothetical protein
MPTRFQLDARSWRVLVLGLLLMAAFAHTVHACPLASDLTGSGAKGSAGGPCLTCLAMQAMVLAFVLAFVILDAASVRSFALLPVAPTRPAFRLGVFTRPPPTF